MVNAGTDGVEATAERLEGSINRTGSSYACESGSVEARQLPSSCRQCRVVGARRWGRRATSHDVADDCRGDGQSTRLAINMVGGLHQRQGCHGRGHLARCLSAAVLHLQHDLLAVVSVVNCRYISITKARRVDFFVENIKRVNRSWWLLLVDTCDFAYERPI